METSELQNQVEKIRAARDDYDSKKSVSNEAHHHLKAEELKLMDMLKKSGLEKFHAPGLGTVSLVTKIKVKMPKDFENKKQLLDFLQSKGDDVLLSYFNINYNSLNTLYNNTLEEAKETGGSFSFPGVEEPQAETELRFRRSK